MLLSTFQAPVRDMAYVLSELASKMEEENAETAADVVVEASEETVEAEESAETTSEEN